MRRLLILFVCVGLAVPGCATAGGVRSQNRITTVRSAHDQTVLREFAVRLKVGTRVRARIADDGEVRGTLLKTTDTAVFIQPRARIAEPVVEVPFNRLVTLEEELPQSNVGKAIAIGAASGAAAALATIMILFAVFSS